MGRNELRWVWASALLVTSAGVAACIETQANGGCVGAACLDGGALDGGVDSARPDGALPPADGAADAADPSSFVVGPAGGTFRVASGLVFDVPPMAVDRDTTLTVTVSSNLPDLGGVDAAVPQDASSDAGADGGSAGGVPAPRSPVFRVEPEGLVFARPVRVSAPLPEGRTEGGWYWAPSVPARERGAQSFDPLGSVTAEGRVIAEVSHLAPGYVAAPSPVRTVTGSWITARVRGAAFVNEAENLESVGLVALSGAFDAGVTEHPGIGYRDGTYRIPGVPSGPYVFRLDGREGDAPLYITAVGAVDLGAATAVRGGASPSQGESGLSVSATNLAAWSSDEHELLYASPATGTYLLGRDSPIEVLPSEGATSVSGAQIPLSGQPLLDGTKGDRAFVFQDVNDDADGGTPYRALARVFELPATTVMVPDAVTPVSGAFAVIPRGESFRCTFDAAGVSAAIAAGAFGRDATWVSATAGAYGVPGALSFGATAFPLVPLAEARVGEPGGGDSTTFTVGPMAFGSFAAGFVPAAVAEVVVAREQVHPFAQLGVTAYGGVRRIDTVAALNGVTFGTALGPPTAPTFNGADLTTSASNTGAAGVLSWTAPVTPPSHYLVSLYELTVVEGEPSTTAERLVARLQTTASSVYIPTGVLETFGYYYLRLTAVYESLPDAGRCAQRRGGQRAEATSLTAVFSPAPPPQ